MTQHNDIPRIRFKGFTGKWERKKLGEIASFSKGQGYSKSDIKQEGMPIILYGSMYTNYKTIIESVTTYTDLKDNSVISKGSEVIIPASGETAEDIAVASAVIQDGIILGGDLNIVYPNSQLSPVYIANVISHGDVHSDISKRAQGKSVVHIHNSDLQGIDISFPTLAEQRAIGAYFAHLDELIEAESQKLDKLKNMKKSCLEKMFPKPGCDVPEVRFKGFTGKWERKKLGEVTTSFEYGLNAPAKEYDGIHKYLRITDIDDETRLFKSDDITSPDIEFSNSEKYLLDVNDIVFARTGASVGKTYIHKNKNDKVYFAGFLIRMKLKDEYDPDFIFQGTLCDDYYKYIQLTSQRSGQPGVNAQEYAEFILPLPSLAEQRAIGAYFAHLDELIEAQGQKVEKLRRVKKACLEGMFV